MADADARLKNIALVLAIIVLVPLALTSFLGTWIVIRVVTGTGNESGQSVQDQVPCLIPGGCR